VSTAVIRCECLYGTGRTLHCRAHAAWLVGVGQRQIDRQYACERHLNRTCWAMIEAEGSRRSVTLTVTPVLPIVVT
jgi:hypothetical protein